MKSRPTHFYHEADFQRAHLPPAVRKAMQLSSSRAAAAQPFIFLYTPSWGLPEKFIGARIVLYWELAKRSSCSKMSFFLSQLEKRDTNLSPNRLGNHFIDETAMQRFKKNQKNLLLGKNEWAKAVNWSCITVHFTQQLKIMPLREFLLLCVIALSPHVAIMLVQMLQLEMFCRQRKKGGEISHQDVLFHIVSTS